MAREITKLIQELMNSHKVQENDENPELAKLRSLITRDRVEDILNRAIEKAGIAVSSTVIFINLFICILIKL